MHKLAIVIYMYVSVYAILYIACESVQPPYQVSLYVNLPARSAPIHICNCVIIQRRLVLAPAQCVYYQVFPDSPSIRLPASMLHIVAGTSNAFTDAVRASISEISILPNFNVTTLKNDLAIFHLSSSLPLGSRDDVKWIILGDDDVENTTCLANFYIRNAMDNLPDYIQTEELEILTSEQCQQLWPYANKRHNDLCSHYILPLGFDCKSLNEFQAYNGDRGTGLLCNNRLVALLSTVLLPKLQTEKEAIDCSALSVKAFYSYLRPHLSWIYEIIAQEEYIDVIQDDYASSTPYQQESNALMQSISLQKEAAHSLIWQGSSTTESTPLFHYYHTNTATTTYFCKIYSFCLIFAYIVL